jgi:hypothetical protein
MRGEESPHGLSEARSQSMRCGDMIKAHERQVTIIDLFQKVSYVLDETIAHFV